MFSNSKISGVSSKLVSFAKRTRSGAALATAISASILGLTPVRSDAGISSITNVSTLTSTGATIAPVTSVSGYGASYSMFNNSSYTYTMDYLDKDMAVTSLTAGGTNYNVTGAGVASIRTSSLGQNNTMIWEVGAGNGSNHSTVTDDGGKYTSYASVLSSNNLFAGADNIFGTYNNPVGNNTNVVRVDMLFSGGIKVSASQAFSIWDRGSATAHDAFEIAAITAFNSATGLPTNYGPITTIGQGDYGNPNGVGTMTENILRINNTVSSDPLHPSDQTTQGLGGVLITTDALGVPTGTTIYGYSIFATTVTATGAELANWTNTTYFPGADATTSGGLDPVAAISNLYTVASSPVPEPTIGAVVVVAAAGLLGRRRKVKQA